MTIQYIYVISGFARNVIQREVAVSNAAHPKALVGRRSVPWLAFLILLVAPGLLRGATFTVTSTNDSGLGSLRQAILNANATPGLDTINFSIGFGPQTIAPTSPLPTITDAAIIDATTQPGYSGSPLIELSGISAGPGANGLSMTSGNSVVQGLAINRFQPQFLVGGGNGILLQTGGGNALRGNFIGTTLDGTAAAGNGGDGILISDSSNNVIGLLAPSSPSVISGNANGVRILGNSNGNLIADSRIGTDVGGNAILANLNAGVAILGGTVNGLLRNVLSGNSIDGLLISGGATGSRVQGNRIGTNLVGTAALPNGTNGIEISGSGTSGNEIGGDSSVGEGNLISGNGLNGILMINATIANRLEGNRIGTDISGVSALGNGANGVIVSGASGNLIGRPGGISSGPQFANVICGNGTNGLRLRSGANGNLVQGNRVGINAVGGPVGNVVAGIQINDGATSNMVGGSGTVLFQTNWISGNIGDGVLIADPATTGNSIFYNDIGLDPSGRPAGNGGNGVRITAGATNNRIGDVALGAANRIANNAMAGVFVESGTGNSIRGNSIYRNGALGIDLAPAGVTPNDHCDGDTGPNLLQNFPVISSASSLGGVTTVTGSLDTTPSSSFTLDFYVNTECDPSGYGQGRFWIAFLPVTTDGSCNASFQKTISSPGPVRFVAATTTDAAGNTSEFSACIPVPAAFYSVTPCRLIDTRGPAGSLGGPALAANTDRSFPLNGKCGIPGSAKAVALTVTVTQPTAQGDLRLYPGGGTLPNSSTTNYRAGQTRASNSIVTLGPSGGNFVVRCVQGSGTVHFIADVAGFFE